MNDTAGMDARGGYYDGARSWADDRSDAIRWSRRVAWIVAGGLGAVALMEAAALVMLVPLKTVQPYTLLVDRTTGFVQALSPLDPGTIAPDTALTRSFLVQYVIARESFGTATLQTDYRKVGLWSAGQARAGYIAQMQPNNASSPVARLPSGAAIETWVKSVSTRSRDNALVRFDTIARDRAGRAAPPRSWVAVIRYRYSDAQMSAQDRFLNPLGFQVNGYRRDQESIRPDVSAGSAEPSPAEGAR